MIGLELNRLDDSPAGVAGGDPARSSTADELRSPAAWLVLALVLERPSHGYEINQRYEDRFGGVWPVSSASVYTALRRLQKTGLVERIVLDTSRRSRGRHIARRSYRATAEGARAYRGWVAERMREDPHRFELIGKIASTGFLGTGALLELIDRYERECVKEMKAMPASDRDQAPGDGDEIAELVVSLVTEQRRLDMRAQLDWVTYARKKIRAHERGQGRRG